MMMMSGTSNASANLLAEGKTKRIESTEENAEQVLVTFKDDATAFNGEKHAIIQGKGAINAAVTRILLTMLAKAGIPTCYVAEADVSNQLLFTRLTMIPLEVVVRNIAFGSFCKRYGVANGQTFEQPLLELFHKSDNDPLINEQAALALGLVRSANDLERITHWALAANELLSGYFAKLGITCADFKLEFGYDTAGNIVLGDELSPDNFRLRDAKTGQVLDKDVFRLDLGDVSQTYQALLARLEAASGAESPAIEEITMQSYQAEVFVKSRKSIFSPQSKAIQEGLHTMGYTDVSGLSAGKRFTFSIEATSLLEAQRQVGALTDALLANPVIEDYQIQVTAAKQESLS